VLYGAFWQEIDVSPVFHLCEQKHCHSARQCIDMAAYYMYFNFLVV